MAHPIPPEDGFQAARTQPIAPGTPPPSPPRSAQSSRRAWCVCVRCGCVRHPVGGQRQSLKLALVSNQGYDRCELRVLFSAPGSLWKRPTTTSTGIVSLMWEGGGAPMIFSSWKNGMSMVLHGSVYGSNGVDSPSARSGMLSDSIPSVDWRSCIATA